MPASVVAVLHSPQWCEAELRREIPGGRELTAGKKGHSWNVSQSSG